jgi:hypothetical protein
MLLLVAFHVAEMLPTKPLAFNDVTDVADLKAIIKPSPINHYCWVIIAVLAHPHRWSFLENALHTQRMCTRLSSLTPSRFLPQNLENSQ